MKMICFRCRKEIEEDSNYYSFLEFNNKVLIKTDYTHKECWDKFLNKISDTSEAMGIIRQLKGKLTNMGILDKEEVILV